MSCGSYQLLIRLDRDTDIRIGRLGTFRFAAGYYIYTGSAMGGVEARVARHLSDSKRFHWHIDYLLEQARVIRYAITVSSTRQECSLACAAAQMPGASVPVKGFGSSDCRCSAHLVYLESEPKKLPAEVCDGTCADGR